MTCWVDARHCRLVENHCEISPPQPGTSTGIRTPIAAVKVIHANHYTTGLKTPKISQNIKFKHFPYIYFKLAQNLLFKGIQYDRIQETFCQFSGEEEIEKNAPLQIKSKISKGPKFCGCHQLDSKSTLNSNLKSAIKPTAQRRARYLSYFRHFHQTTPF